MFPFNRTTVECKDAIKSCFFCYPYSFNRTTVECKDGGSVFEGTAIYPLIELQ